MEVKIIRGTSQIGGCIAEITSNKGVKILIDYGEELTDDPDAITDFPIEGLTKGESIYKAVFITHSHGDHIGLIKDINKDIPVYVEKTSAKIFKVSNDFCSKEPFTGDLHLFTFERPIVIEDLTITPYLTDHSAYNSAMFLVENDGKKLLHLGDYRSNGYNAKKFYQNLKKIGKVDLVITEGTNVTRDKVNDTEKVLEEKAEKLFRQYKQVFILQASTNLDRLKSFHDAALKTGKKFILDISTANILKAINSRKFPYLKEKDVSVWFPSAYSHNNKRFYERKGEDFYDKYIKEYEHIKERKKEVHGEYVMLVKTSMLKDIEIFLQRYRDNAVLVYSMWTGYKDEKRPNTEKTRNFIAGLKKLNIKEEYLHTSGHADPKTIIEVCNIVNPKKTIGIHTEDNTLLKDKVPNYQIVKDGEIVEV